MRFGMQHGTPSTRTRREPPPKRRAGPAEIPLPHLASIATTTHQKLDGGIRRSQRTATPILTHACGWAAFACAWKYLMTRNNAAVLRQRTIRGQISGRSPKSTESGVLGPTRFRLIANVARPALPGAVRSQRTARQAARRCGAVRLDIDALVRGGCTRLHVVPQRPDIPAEIIRQLMIDAGWRCSIPTCGTTSALEIDHIEEWSKVREHKYENLIVLCPTHHAMKQTGSRPRELNVTALKIVKQNQIALSGRYGDVERRVLEHFVRNPGESEVVLPGDFEILLMHLLDAGLLKKEFEAEGSVIIHVSEVDSTPTPETSLVIRQVYRLTTDGRSTIEDLRNARSIR